MCWPTWPPCADRCGASRCIITSTHLTAFFSPNITMPSGPPRPANTAFLGRRALLVSLAAGANAAHAQTQPQQAQAQAQAQDISARIAGRNEEQAAVTVRRLLGDAKPQTGRIQITLPDIAESGNSVPVTVRVESPMTAADHVRVIHIVAERNPRPWVASFRLGPRAGRAQVDTQIRLSDTQSVAVYAQMSDASWWMQRKDVIVTIGACESMDIRY